MNPLAFSIASFQFCLDQRFRFLLVTLKFLVLHCVQCPRWVVLWFGCLPLQFHLLWRKKNVNLKIKKLRRMWKKYNENWDFLPQFLILEPNWWFGICISSYPRKNKFTFWLYIYVKNSKIFHFRKCYQTHSDGIPSVDYLFSQNNILFT